MLSAPGTRLTLALGRLGGRKLVRRGRFGSIGSRGWRWRKRAAFEQRDFETKRAGGLRGRYTQKNACKIACKSASICLQVRL